MDRTNTARQVAARAPFSCRSKSVQHLARAALCGLVLAASLLLIPLNSQAASIYSIVDLGTLGGSGSEATGINNEGQVVGTAETAIPVNANGGRASHAFLYTPGSGMQDLGTLGRATQHSVGLDINNVGQVTGYAYLDIRDPVQNRTVEDARAFVFTPGVGIMDIGTLTDDIQIGSIGRAINDAGQVAGCSARGGACSHAFVYTPGSPLEDLGPFGGLRSTPLDINNAGQVVGVADGAPSGAFVYTPGIGMQDLGTLGGKSSAARVINDDGQVIGDSNTASNAQHAFLYTPGVGMLDLEPLGFGPHQSIRDSNKFNQIVGGLRPGGAFIYSLGFGLVNLQTLLPDSSGWTLEIATGINDSGQITGTGTIGGNRRAFLMTPVPIPASLWLLAPALAGLAMRRRPIA